MRVTDTSNGSTSKYWEDFFTDEAAAEYMLTYGEGPGTPLRHKLGSYLKSEEKVLDVGCGPGWNFDHFLQHGPSVYYRGIDYSKRFIKVASERVKPMNIFKVGDARKLEEPNGSFDVVILQDCLEHIDGYEKPVHEALRVARRRVIVTFWHLKDEDDPHINVDGGDTYGAWYDKREWEKYLNSLGLDWFHEDIPRKGQKHDIYIIDKEIV